MTYVFILFRSHLHLIRKKKDPQKVINRQICGFLYIWCRIGQTVLLLKQRFSTACKFNFYKKRNPVLKSDSLRGYKTFIRNSTSRQQQQPKKSGNKTLRTRERPMSVLSRVERHPLINQIQSIFSQHYVSSACAFISLSSALWLIEFIVSFPIKIVHQMYLLVSQQSIFYTQPSRQTSTHPCRGSKVRTRDRWCSLQQGGSGNLFFFSA